MENGKRKELDLVEAIYQSNLKTKDVIKAQGILISHLIDKVAKLEEINGINEVTEFNSKEHNSFPNDPVIETKKPISHCTCDNKDRCYTEGDEHFLPLEDTYDLCEVPRSLGEPPFDGVICEPPFNELTIEPPFNELTIDPSSNELTIDPSSNELTIEPTPNELTIEPPSNELTIEPPSNELTIKPPSNELTIKPPSNELTIEPPSNELTIEPPSKEPPSNELIIEPASNKLTIEPPLNELAIEPSSNELTIEPPSKELIIEPPSNELIIEPASNKLTIEPSSNELTIKPPSNEVTIEPPLNELEKEPPLDELTIEPPLDELTIKPSLNELEIVSSCNADFDMFSLYNNHIEKNNDKSVVRTSEFDKPIHTTSMENKNVDVNNKPEILKDEIKEVLCQNNQISVLQEQKKHIPNTHIFQQDHSTMKDEETSFMMENTNNPIQVSSMMNTNMSRDVNSFNNTDLIKHVKSNFISENAISHENGGVNEIPPFKIENTFFRPDANNINICDEKGPFANFANDFQMNLLKSLKPILEPN